MSSRIEDYALIGNCRTAALVGLDGSIDWLCLPYFDSGACFAALLGESKHGRWLLAPAEEVRQVRRHYRSGTLVLETEFETTAGSVTVVDAMPLQDAPSDLVRIVVGKHGQVRMRCELVIRFDYGSVVPWVRRTPDGISAIAGPDMIQFTAPVDLRGVDFTTVGDFSISAGQRIPFCLTGYDSYQPKPTTTDPEKALAETEAWWRQWSSRCTYRGEWSEAVTRSLITLKALIFAPTGGIVAAATTSLPEQLGGERNWDYRYCWIRDATFTLYALMLAGYKEEARAWREWLLRAVAGMPSELQIMYSITGRRRLTEETLGWLPGYDNSQPVRVGNAAHGQLQLDVYGELLDAMYQSRRIAIEAEQAEWNLEKVLLKYLEMNWDQPDEGIWEVRGPRREFTHSKMMVWVALDRAVKAVENMGLDGPVDRWRKLRDEVHEQVCQAGYSSRLNAFVQYYGSEELDASLLMMPLVGFLPADDPRMLGTVAAIEKHLMRDDLIARYSNRSGVDGLPGTEGAFLPCTFWYVDNLALQGREDDARRVFERLLAIRNGVGLLSEEYDPHTRRFLGNFPQAFSHVSLVNSACNLSAHVSPARHRQET